MNTDLIRKQQERGLIVVRGARKTEVEIPPRRLCSLSLIFHHIVEAQGENKAQNWSGNLIKN